MNDALYEQLVSRKTNPLMPVLKVLIICIMAAGLVTALLFAGFWSAVLIVILAFFLYYFVFPRFSVEYEYTLVNYDVDIDAIYSKKKRKKKFSFDLRTAELIAPADSEALSPYRSAKVRDFTSHSHSENVYSVILSAGQSRVNVRMEPDEMTLRHFRQWAGSKFQKN